MKKPQIWLSIFALIVGVLMVMISINTSMPAAYPSSGFQASHRQFYLNNTILPDHILYPVLMTVDKFQLETTPFPERLWLQAEYGWRRLDYARQLIDKNKIDLALTAFTKSQKYLLNATQETLDAQTTNEIRLKMLKHLTAYLWEAKIIADNFDTAQKAVVDRLISECESIKLRLGQSLSH
ncbi:hypothetical protein KJ654_04065 [Patescibacteria group bacterium]|nr:hypothetical protein [Patescibacteria group bacterium]MBU1967466.1 hypothetical protein [Patescibacteria group bacterium]